MASYRMRLTIFMVFFVVCEAFVPAKPTMDLSTAAGTDVGFNWKWLNQLLANATFKFPDTEFPLGKHYDARAFSLVDSLSSVHLPLSLLGQLSGSRLPSKTLLAMT